MSPLCWFICLFLYECSVVVPARICIISTYVNKVVKRIKASQKYTECSFTAAGGCSTVQMIGRGRCGASGAGSPAGKQPAAASSQTAPAERRGAAGLRGAYFGLQDNIWTALQCCCRGDTQLFMLHFYTFWTPFWCSPSTWTPDMSSGKTESRGACSGFLLQCTGN